MSICVVKTKHTHTHTMSSLLPLVVHPWSTVGLWAMCCTSLPYDPPQRSPGLILATHQNHLIATNLDFPFHKVLSPPSFLSSDRFIFGLTTKLLRKCQKALQYVRIWSYSLDTKFHSKWWKHIEKLRHSTASMKTVLLQNLFMGPWGVRGLGIEYTN
jgi:hypothetical protein